MRHSGSPRKRAIAPARRSDGDAERMLDVLRQFRVVIRSIKQHYQWVERRCGVSGAQLWAMERIAATRGITPGDLARELAIHPSTASNLLARLEALKLVERHRRHADQRRVQLYLTARAQAVLAKAPRPLKGVLQQALADLPPTQLARLHKGLDELLRLMRNRDEAAQRKLLAEF
jgi:DNA-binding MarR family transcriptional regulator